MLHTCVCACAYQEDVPSFTADWTWGWGAAAGPPDSSTPKKYKGSTDELISYLTQ